MRRLISALLSSLPTLGNAVCFMMFIFLLFGILGVQQFGSSMYQRCRFTDEPNEDGSWPIDMTIPNLCSKDSMGFQCPQGRYCHGPLDAGLSAETDDIINDVLIDYGITVFDNLGIGFITVFQMITLEGWTKIMYNMMDSNIAWMAIIFSVLLTVVGAFFLLNVILAVLAEALNKVELIEKKQQAKQDRDVFMSLKRRELQDEKRMKADPTAKRSEILTHLDELRAQQDYHTLSAENLAELQHEQQQKESNNNNISKKKQREYDSKDGAETQRNEVLENKINDQLKNEDLTDGKHRMPINYLQLEEMKQHRVQYDETRLTPSLSIEPHDVLRGSSALRASSESRRQDKQNEDEEDVEIKPEAYFLNNGSVPSIQLGHQIPLDQIGEVSHSSHQESHGHDSISQTSREKQVEKAENVLSQFRDAVELMQHESTQMVQQQNQNAQNESMISARSERTTSSLDITIPDRAHKNRTYMFFYQLCSHWAFTAVITLMILLNTAALAMESHPVNKQRQIVADIMNEVFTWCFLAEMIIKLIGLGVKDYTRDAFNIFDACLVIISMIDYIVLQVPQLNVSSGGALSAFRSIRLLRVFKLARSWTSFRVLLKQILFTVREVAYFLVLLSIVMFIFALLGMELYGSRVRFNLDETVLESEDQPGLAPRPNFDSFYMAMTSIFILFIGEDWQILMHSHYRAQGISALIFFPALYTCLHLIQLNLFLAILLRNFEMGQRASQDPDKDDVKTMKRIKLIFHRIYSSICCRHRHAEKISISAEVELKKGEIVIEKEENEDQEAQSNDLKSGEQVNSAMESKKSQQSVAGRQLQQKRVTGDQFEIAPQWWSTQQLLKPTRVNMSIAALKKLDFLDEAGRTQKKNIKLTGKSCSIFGPENKLRKFCKTIVQFSYYDSIVMGLIIISTILLTLDNPLNDKNGTLSKVLSLLDVFLTFCFTMECLINIIVLGFAFNGQSSYMRDSWNILDFLIVVFSLINIAAAGVDIGIIKLFRMLRVLRPLRVLKRNLGLKIQVISLLNSIPSIMNLLAITMLLLMLFGIQGVNFFAGKMNHCDMSKLPVEVRQDIKSEFDCYDYGGSWVSYEARFDNIGEAMLTMFTMMTTEGWTDIMWQLVDTTTIHQAPVRDSQPAYIIFCTLFLFLASLFMLNLFVGVVISTFNREKDELSNKKLLTLLQQEYLEILLNVYLANPERSFTLTGNKFRDGCRKIANSSIFNNLILACIILNTICLSVTWFGEPELLTRVMEIVNIGFTIVYTLEMVIKLIAFKSSYFKDGWNNFDFLIVIFAWIGFLAHYVFDIKVGALTTVVRSFRILRVLKLIRKAPSLQKIVNTFMLAIPELMNVGALLFLFLFLFAVLGVFLFSEVKLQAHLSEHANFQHFGIALLTLFRITTGEGWQNIMYDCARQPGAVFSCTQNQTFEQRQEYGIKGCGTMIAYAYFSGFMLVVSLIFLNLFIAIILEGQSLATQQQEARVSESTRQSFIKAWTKYDPDASGFIKVDNLSNIIIDLAHEEYRMRKAQIIARSQVLFNFTRFPEVKLLMKIKKDLPLNKTEEFARNNQKVQDLLEWEFKKFMIKLALPLYNGLRDYNFHDILSAFVKLVFAQQHRQDYDERSQRIEYAFTNNTTHLLPFYDRIQIQSHEWDRLSIIDQERVLEADDPEFQSVVDRMEAKGQGEKMILQLNNVRRLRVATGKKTKNQMDLNFNRQNVLDSSHLIGGRRIVQFWIEHRERQEKLAKLRIERARLSAINTTNRPSIDPTPIMTPGLSRIPDVPNHGANSDKNNDTEETVNNVQNHMSQISRNNADELNPTTHTFMRIERMKNRKDQISTLRASLTKKFKSSQSDENSPPRQSLPDQEEQRGIEQFFFPSNEQSKVITQGEEEVDDVVAQKNEQDEFVISNGVQQPYLPSKFRKSRKNNLIESVDARLEEQLESLGIEEEKSINFGDMSLSPLSDKKIEAFDYVKVQDGKAEIEQKMDSNVSYVNEEGGTQQAQLPLISQQQLPFSDDKLVDYKQQDKNYRTL